MPLELDRLLELRPFLYHLTATANLDRILRTEHLSSARNTLIDAGEPHLVRERRPEAHIATVRGEPVHLRDQAPLYKGNVAFAEGWTFADLLEDLNRRVYFWPGTEEGPTDYGRRHFARYELEATAVLVIPTRALLGMGVDPRFCAYNSGSPRCSGGRKSPRGPSTFLPAESFEQTPSQVVEVTFLDAVPLPMRDVTIRPTSCFL